MKVCLLNDSFPPVIDGVVNVMMNYADYLMSDHASEVIVGTPRYPGADYSGYRYKVVPYQSLPTAAVTNGYRTGNPFASKAVAEMAAFGPDIIHSHCPASATVIARILREATTAPIIFTYHTKYDIDIRRVVKGMVADETIKLMVKNIEACDDVWVVSRGAGESLKALGFQGDYRVVTNGVDFEKGRADDAAVAEAVAGYDLPEGLPVFLYVGRLMTYKGLPLLLDALKLISDSGQDFRMVFIGKGPDRELLEKKAVELGLMGGDGAEPSKCIFVGPIYDRDKLRAWNTRADLFLFPSTFDTNGLVVREAAACGLASVLIQGSCAAEGITDGRNGFTIEETPEAMAELLKKTSKDLSRLREVGQHAMDEIYVSWQTCVAEAYERYQYILEEKRRGSLAAKRKLPSDYLVSLTALGMGEQERLRQQGRLFLQSVRETTSGMMQNFRDVANEMRDDFQEAGLLAEERWNKMFNGFQEAEDNEEDRWIRTIDYPGEKNYRKNDGNNVGYDVGNDVVSNDGNNDGNNVMNDVMNDVAEPEAFWNRLMKELRS